MTQFWDRQQSDRSNRGMGDVGDADRRSMEARTCPACLHVGALRRTVENDGSLRLVCRQEHCNYQRAVPLEQLAQL